MLLLLLILLPAELILLQGELLLEELMLQLLRLLQLQKLLQLRLEKLMLFVLQLIIPYLQLIVLRLGYIRYTIDLKVLSNELSAYHIQLQPLGQHGEESFAAHLLLAQLHSAIDICGMILRVGHDNQFAEVTEYLMAKGLEKERERARLGVEITELAHFYSP